MECSDDYPDAQLMEFYVEMDGQLLRINTLLIAHTVLVGVMVGIGAYKHRYRHHRLFRYLFLGVTTLFLPIVSYVISTTSNLEKIADSFKMICYTPMLLILLWSALVQNVGINTTVIVAGDVREARDIAPSVVLLVEAIWTCYLLSTQVSIFDSDFGPPPLFLYSPWALIFAKLLLKYYSWYQARKSLAFGNNPRLIAGYMEHLHAERSQHVELACEHMPPPLIVVGEEDIESLQKQPHGYSFTLVSNILGDHSTRRINKNGLMTMDMVWQMLPRSRAHQQIKDVCFPFALFKLLRCRYARYTIADAGLINFLWHVLLEQRDDERLLGVIVCELNFLHDYYYSSLPISYSKIWLPILSILISLLSIGLCLYLTVHVTVLVLRYYLSESVHESLVACLRPCRYGMINFGSVWFLVVPLISLVVLVLLAEVREIASYICSNWTKIALIRWQASSAHTMKKWFIGHVLQCRCKLLEHWEDKMNLCSIIMLHPAPLARVRRLISLPDQKKKVPTAVKAAIIHALRSHARARNMTTSLQLKVGDNLLWTFNAAKGTTDIILLCHVATSILEVRSDPHLAPSDHKVAATHLSRYCAYLVAYSPELLPDFDHWCKSMYKAVKKDMKRIGLVVPEASTPSVKYQLLLEQLTTRSDHEVLRSGAELGRQLVELPQGEEKAWEVLAGFWSEMVLHIAPSENLDGHAEAIARGGELITLVWALLGHLGTFSRPDHIAPAATTC